MTFKSMVQDIWGETQREKRVRNKVRGFQDQDFQDQNM